jgi:hypothetical protein
MVQPRKITTRFCTWSGASNVTAGRATAHKTKAAMEYAR